MKQRAILSTIFLFVGCCSNVYFLEHLIKYAPGAGNIVTFVQFLVISTIGFIFTAKLGKEKPKVPISKYVLMVILFFLVQVSNNWALNFKISMPLHMIFRSGSLMANMALGIIILKRKYKASKFVAVAMITVGIVTCTIASIHQEEKTESSSSLVDYVWWAVGVFLLSFALFVSARLGIMQEQIALGYGKHPEESLFYSHALPLPCFLILSGDIYKHAVLFSRSAPVLLPLIGISLPIMWVYIACNQITQYICIRSVYNLTVEYSSLTVTLIITLRKFISVIISIVYFRNPFTVFHWIGTILVFCGTMVFADVLQLVRGAEEESQKFDVKAKED